MNLYGLKRKLRAPVKNLTLAEYIEASDKAARDMAKRSWKDFKLITKDKL